MLLIATLVLVAVCAVLLRLLVLVTTDRGHEVARRRQAEARIVELNNAISRLHKALEAEDRERARIDAGGLLADDGHRRD